VIGAALLILNRREDGAENMKRTQIRLGIIAFTLGILSVLPTICAAEPLQVDANGDAAAEPFAPDVGAAINLPPFRTNQNLTLAVESPDEAAQADQLAKQLANPIASLINLFRQTRTGGLALPAMATNSRLTFSRSFQSRSAKTGT
jgi:hypothetical protein